MPVFEANINLKRPLEEVFEFFQRPANLPRVSPPELHLTLVEGPDLLQLGSRIVVLGRRWGIGQRIASEVTAFEAKVMFVDEQREGPFRKFSHTHRFAALPEGGTQVRDRIEYEPPGGALGFLLTAGFIERDLRWIFEYRSGKLRELLG